MLGLTGIGRPYSPTHSDVIEGYRTHVDTLGAIADSGHDWDADPATWVRAQRANPDCLIGAVTVGIGARLATGDTKDFPMPQLTVEKWPPGF
ncbi:MAG: hypothetical protein DLM62_12390 [Pseudonocardiales bacterium]|nr:MAG: hypothetical protein DLM62_12390 [Pseudonocardiales bacterium]